MWVENGLSENWKQSTGSEVCLIIYFSERVSPTVRFWFQLQTIPNKFEWTSFVRHNFWVSRFSVRRFIDWKSSLNLLSSSDRYTVICMCSASSFSEFFMRCTHIRWKVSVYNFAYSYCHNRSLFPRTKEISVSRHNFVTLLHINTAISINHSFMLVYI